MNKILQSLLELQQSMAQSSCLFSCFTDPKSVTEKLQAMGALQVNCLRSAPLLHEQYAWLREVTLSVDGAPLVWGLTLLPQQTIEQHSWFKRWGNRSLGEKLFADNLWRRGEQQIYPLAKNHACLQYVSQQYDLDAAPYIRKSHFVCADHGFDLYELFSVGMAE